MTCISVAAAPGTEVCHSLVLRHFVDFHGANVLVQFCTEWVPNVEIDYNKC